LAGAAAVDIARLHADAPEDVSRKALKGDVGAYECCLHDAIVEDKFSPDPAVAAGVACGGCDPDKAIVFGAMLNRTRCGPHRRDGRRRR